MAVHNSPHSDLERLNEFATHNSFKELQHFAQDIRQNYSHRIDATNVGKIRMPGIMVDRAAEMVLGTPTKRNIVGDARPVRTGGDGNCLFNAASIAICGNQSLASELRLRTAIELILNPDYYQAHPVVASFDLSTKSGKNGSSF